MRPVQWRYSVDTYSRRLKKLRAFSVLCIVKIGTNSDLVDGTMTSKKVRRSQRAKSQLENCRKSSLKIRKVKKPDRRMLLIKYRQRGGRDLNRLDSNASRLTLSTLHSPTRHFSDDISPTIVSLVRNDVIRRILLSSSTSTADE